MSRIYAGILRDSLPQLKGIKLMAASAGADFLLPLRQSSCRSRCNRGEGAPMCAETGFSCSSAAIFLEASNLLVVISVLPHEVQYVRAPHVQIFPCYWNFPVQEIKFGKLEAQSTGTDKASAIEYKQAPVVHTRKSTVTALSYQQFNTIRLVKMQSTLGSFKAQTTAPGAPATAPRYNHPVLRSSAVSICICTFPIRSAGSEYHNLHVDKNLDSQDHPEAVLSRL